MSDLSDWELVGLAREGDTAAFALIVRRYQQPVVRFCAHMVGSVEEAEDLAQESFIRVFRHLGRLQPRAKFSTVLFGIARNLALNAIRSARRRRRHPAAEAHDPEENPRTMAVDPAPGPGAVARHGEIAEMVREALQSLSPDHREVLVLREMDGLDYDTIARITRTRTGTVKSRLARAREQLRQQMTALGGEEL
jgi:RNA polymerase sigma-70 factor, ECF subfamily